MQGLQSVTRGITMNFDIEPGEFVQILHNGHGHWLTISTVGNEHPQVEVYDSVYSCCPTLCKAQIAALLSTKQPAIHLKYMDVQMQAGGYDCGLFAIAFATAIVFGKQPGLFCFDQPKMREHYKKCLEQGHITKFPLQRMRRRAKIKTTGLISVYTALVECLNLRRPNGSNVQDVNSGSILIRASKLNQSTLILNVTGFAHSVSKTPAVVLYLMLYLMILHITLLNQTFNHCFCTLCITLAHSCTTFKIFLESGWRW